MITEYTKIDDIRGLWETLQAQNESLTFFQSYCWNQCLEKRFQSLKFLKYKNCVLEYLVLDQELIAPLVINKSEKRITILGHDESSDYLSFIHKTESSDNLAKHIKQVLEHHPDYTFQLGKINESFPMHQAMEQLISGDVRLLETHTAACVLVRTDYEKSIYDCMTKSKKQNYRTSLNRMEKDGHTFRVEMQYGKIDKEKSHGLYKLYFQRRSDCDEQRSGLVSQFYAKLRYQLGVSKWGDRVDVLSNYAKKSQVFLAMIYIDGALAAFCEGDYSNDGKRLCIARVATNSEFYKYSPGMVMFVKVIDSLKNRIDCFDLTRGTEQYKFDLNGVKHLNYSYKVTV